MFFQNVKKLLIGLLSLGVITLFSCEEGQDNLAPDTELQVQTADDLAVVLESLEKDLISNLSKGLKASKPNRRSLEIIDSGSFSINTTAGTRTFFEIDYKRENVAIAVKNISSSPKYFSLSYRYNYYTPQYLFEDEFLSVNGQYRTYEYPLLDDDLVLDHGSYTNAIVAWVAFK